MYFARAARMLPALALFISVAAITAGGAQAAPSVTITSPVNGATLLANARQMRVASLPGSRLLCRIDRGKRRVCRSRVLLSSLRDGMHHATVTAVAPSGDVAVAATRFRIDTKAPVVTISSPVPEQVFTGRATAIFKANEVAQFSCRVNFGPSEPCTSGVSSDEIADGRNLLTVVAQDAAGNVGSAQVSFVVKRPASRPPTEPTAPVSAPAPEPSPPVAQPTAPVGAPTPTGPTGPAPTPDPPPAASLQASAVDSSHIRLAWTPPSGSATVEIVRRDLVDSTPDVVVATVLATTTEFTDAQLWYANSYRYTLTFRDAAGLTKGTLTASAATLAVTASTFPVPFASSPHIGTKLTASTTMAAADVTTRYRNYVVNHTRNANLTLRSYGVPVYEAKTGDRQIGPFNCGYNCQLPRTGAATVPLPTKPKPVGILGLGLMADPGSDKHMTIVAANGTTAWDFYHPDEDNTDVDKTNAAVWQFIQAGATFSPNAANPAIAAPPSYAAANAANFSNLAGLIRPEELALGEIRHALMMSVPGIGSAVAGQNVPACPATHNAKVNDPLTGTANPDAPPEGLRFRLDPAFNVNAITSPVARIIAKAMQDYGVYIRDNGGTVSVYAESTGLSTVSGSTVGGRGYDGWNKAHLGLPVNSNSVGLPTDFPWNQLAVVNFTNGPNC